MAKIKPNKNKTGKAHFKNIIVRYRSSPKIRVTPQGIALKYCNTHTQSGKANTKIHILPKLLEHLISPPLHSKELAKSYPMKSITIFIDKF